MNLPDFEAKLHGLTGSSPTIRPFVCDGSPLACSAFVVGTNPATEVGFWNFWNVTYGFQKTEWLLAYEEVRSAKGENGASPTRRMIEKVVEAAAPVRCLETNVFSKPSPRAADLKRGDQQTRIFRFLLEAIQPRALLLHGQHAREHFQNLSGTRLTLGIPRTVLLRAGPVRVLATHHLSFQGSYQRATDSGRWLASS
jgi:hypothetical protein